MSGWPDSNDYTIAIQTPSACFRDADLKRGSAERHTLTRMPKVSTGNFAQVYELKYSSKRWAVKCFTRSASDIRERYSELAKAIALARLPYFIDFMFLDEEMLVNGKRYPVVKMEWLVGQPLDKFVEANLYRPSALLGTASQLVQLVRDLEQHQLAHGDLQHGNIVITAGGLKLVDYDGMFAPAFAGRMAPEIGLPAFQHPKRGRSDYAVGLDRFSLLVLCTGLCALAAEPALWYEFNTGENILFTADDFRHPSTSKLMARLRSVSDPQLKRLLESLVSACTQPPLSVALPVQSISSDTPKRTPWWVSTPTVESVRRSDKSQPAPSLFGSYSAAARMRGSWGIAGVFVVGLIVAVLTWLFDASVGGGVGGLALAVLTIGRFVSYNRLPVLQHQRALQEKIRQARTGLAAAEKLKKAAEQRLAAALQQEASEKSLALKRIQEAHVAARLSGIDISRLMDIRGIGPSIVGNFRVAGVNNALQLRQRGPHAKGVGAQRRQLIEATLAEWERAAGQGSPSRMSGDDERRIEAKYAGQRQAATQEIAAMTHRLGAIGSGLHQAEWNLKQVRVPTFVQYVKHSF